MTTFFFISKLTIADLALFNVLEYPIDLFGFTLVEYPRVAAHRAMMAGLRVVANYLEKRQAMDQPATMMIKPAIEKW